MSRQEESRYCARKGALPVLHDWVALGRFQSVQKNQRTQELRQATIEIGENQAPKSKQQMKNRGINMIKKALSLLAIVVCLLSVSQTAYAKESIQDISGSVYEFSAKDNYIFSGSSASATEQDKLGDFSISGDMEDAGEKDGFKQYTVDSGNLTLSYKFNSSILDAADTDWHLIEDKTKKVDSFSLDKNISKGAVIVQSSKDGENWITDYQLCDAFKTTDSIGDSIYTTKDVQLENGCFYRVIVVYKMQVKTGEKKIAFVTTDVTEEKRVAEVYSFYAVSEKNDGSTVSAADEPRKEIASSPVKTEKDKGFSGEKTIDKDDPHFGWKLGTFVINGYTREATYGDNTYYLKNVGDKVILWFTLNQDINKLNGNSNYSIAEDVKAYDRTFGVPETNFGHGTLIISYTDYQGKTYDPIIYTDFLAANATTGADTRVQLFEEGDYDVVLDYEIKNTPRKVGSIAVIPEYTDYKIAFSFSIRNGNCMVYPFDLKSGNELSDKAITENGFKLDEAKSRYLDVNVAKAVIKVNEDGLLAEDIRFNRPAKDNESYSDEGIYTFTVKNRYTDADTKKTIYVGNNKYYAALAKNRTTVDALNEKIAAGYTIESDGTLVEPVIETSSEAVPEPEPTIEENEPSEKSSEVSTAENVENSDAEQNESVEASDEKGTEELTDDAQTKSNSASLPFVVLGIVVAGGVIGFAIKNKRKKGETK